MKKFDLDESGRFSPEQIRQLHQLPRGSMFHSIGHREYDAISRYENALRLAGIAYKKEIINAQQVFQKI